MTTAALLTNIDRKKTLFTPLFYEFQERRLEHACLLQRFLGFPRKLNKRTFDFVSTPIPLWRLTRTGSGRRVLPLPAIRGAEGSRGPEFSCTPQRLNGSAAVCLTLSGELDVATVPTFRAHLTAAHDAEGLLLDIRDLRYLDSSGINVLLDIHKAFASSGRRIALLGASPHVRRILSVLHLEDLMPAFGSLDEAVLYLQADGPTQESTNRPVRIHQSEG